MTEEVKQEAPSKKRGGKKAGIIAGIVAAVIVVAGIGFFVWHEQPSFCGAICHTPMDEYLVTYEQEPDVEGTDKYGNPVANTSSMLAVTHRLEGATCLSCHKPTMSQQINEGIAWITGGYEFPLEERSLTDLTAALGTEPESFCMNDECHNLFDREGLVKMTSYMEYNPHSDQMGAYFECSNCHKAHTASVNFCAKCHPEAETPAGWAMAA